MPALLWFPFHSQINFVSSHEKVLEGITVCGEIRQQERFVPIIMGLGMRDNPAMQVRTVASRHFLINQSINFMCMFIALNFFLISSLKQFSSHCWYVYFSFDAFSNFTTFHYDVLSNIAYLFTWMVYSPLSFVLAPSFSWTFFLIHWYKVCRLQLSLLP